MDIVSRLKKYMEHRGIPTTQFADIASIPRPTLSQILSGRNKKISNELLVKIHSAYPDLDINWLLFGDGNMIDGTAPQAQAPEIKKDAPAQENKADAFGGLFGVQDIEIPIPEEMKATRQVQQAVQNSDNAKKIQNIIVFYTDSSFEIFSPAQK